MNELAADGIPVAVSSRVLCLARAPYYRWLAEPVTQTEWDQAHRANALFDAHREDPEFGYRYLHDEAAAASLSMAARTAWKLCSANAWWSSFVKKRAKNGKKPSPPVHDDLLAVIDEHGVTRHRFSAQQVNEVWLTEITEHRTREGKVYLCAVKDVYSGRIAGYAISDRMKARLAVAALDSALARGRGEGHDVSECIVHSDRGSQFRS